MRKLASIQKIIALEPIEGADAIEKATVLGWQLVVKKGEFQVNDLVVYCEIDSLLPERPEFEFLKPRGMRIRTVRLRGQISQGICFPLSILPSSLSTIEEDMDVTDVLEIVKYEPPIPACLAGTTKGDFPSFIPKTDETRVQVLQELLNEYEGVECYVAEKVDGSSQTCYIKDGEFGVCSRNLELKESEENSYWKAARMLQIEEKLRSVGKNIAIQGELVGEGIQKNKLKIKGQTILFFNAFDIDEYRYYDYKEMIELFRQLELTTVPILEESYNLENNIPSIIEKAKIKSSLNKNVWAEGIVIRPCDQKNSSYSKGGLLGGRISFKAINPEFLIKYEE